MTVATKSRLLDLEQSNNNLRNKIEVEKLDVGQPITFTDAYDFLQEYAKMNYDTEEAKAKMLQLFVRKVELCDDKLLIRYNTSADTEYVRKEKSNWFDDEFKLVACGGR